MNIEIGTIYKLNDDGTDIAANVVARPPRMVEYVSRKNNRGAWTKKPTLESLKVFRTRVVGKYGQASR